MYSNEKIKLDQLFLLCQAFTFHYRERLHLSTNGASTYYSIIEQSCTTWEVNQVVFYCASILCYNSYIVSIIQQLLYNILTLRVPGIYKCYLTPFWSYLEKALDLDRIAEVWFFKKLWQDSSFIFRQLSFSWQAVVNELFFNCLLKKHPMQNYFKVAMLSCNKHHS